MKMPCQISLPSSFFQSEESFSGIRGKIPALRPLKRGAVKRFGICHLTLPSPVRGEGKHMERKKYIPSPSTGEGTGGGDLWDYLTASGG
jgi:hypothetical protein